jgi:hypothetical protein
MKFRKRAHFINLTEKRLGIKPTLKKRTYLGKKRMSGYPRNTPALI